MCKRILACFLVAPRAFGTFSFIVALGASSTNQINIPTSALNTIGATLIVSASSAQSVASPTPTNSNSSRLTGSPEQTMSGLRTRFYSTGPKVGVGHMFIVSLTTSARGRTMMAFAGASPAHDTLEQNGVLAIGSTTIQSAVTAVGSSPAVRNVSLPTAIDSGFSGTVASVPASNNHWGVFSSYLIETSPPRST